MSDHRTNAVGNGFDSRGRFVKGNQLARGNPLNRLAKAMRARAVRHAQQTGAVDAIFEQLKADATDPNAPGIVRVAASKVYLSYVLGKPDQTINVNRNEERTAPAITPEEAIARLRLIGIPVEGWPLELQMHVRKQVESRVIESAAKEGA
jgi:hypothetical protein